MAKSFHFHIFRSWMNLSGRFKVAIYTNSPFVTVICLSYDFIWTSYKLKFQELFKSYNLHNFFNFWISLENKRVQKASLNCKVLEAFTLKSYWVNMKVVQKVASSAVLQFMTKVLWMWYDNDKGAILRCKSLNNTCIGSYNYWKRAFKVEILFLVQSTKGLSEPTWTGGGIISKHNRERACMWVGTRTTSASRFMFSTEEDSNTACTNWPNVGNLTECRVGQALAHSPLNPDRINSMTRATNFWISAQHGLVEGYIPWSHK